MKIRPVGAELFHADGHTDRRDEANNRFHNFTYASSKNAAHDFNRAQNTINSEFIFSLFSVSFEKYVIIVRPSRHKTFAVSRSVLSFCSRVRRKGGSLSGTLNTVSACCSAYARQSGIHVVTFPSFTMAVDTADIKRREYALYCCLWWGSTFSEPWRVRSR
jgi:hypothetical protein